MRRLNTEGFTLIELIMVILLLAILAAIAIPNFIDFRGDAKNAATNGALGALRTAISVASASVALKEDPGNPTPKYPTFAEVSANAFTATHPVLNGTAIMDPSQGLPKNPWTDSTAAAADHNKVYDCSAMNKGDLRAAAGETDRGWCYKDSTGEMWPNSDRNGGAVGQTENTF